MICGNILNSMCLYKKPSSCPLKTTQDLQDHHSSY